ncbi:MAG: hypothetical protein M3179_13115 [Actinomycetota bacterium]|nr:hypothetical protein [Actinomycetota bacterium]
MAQQRSGAVASTTATQGRRVASTAAQRGQQVVEATGDDAKSLVAKTKEQASAVAEDATDQARDMLDQTKTRVQEQTASQTQRLADRLAEFGDEAMALSEGRAEDAERARRIASQAAEKLFEAADKVSVVADDIEERGLEGLLDDVQRFARRRPGLFLFGAAVAGFGVGRLVRARDPEPGDELDGGGASTNGRARGTSGAQRAIGPSSTRRATASVGGR